MSVQYTNPWAGTPCEDFYNLNAHAKGSKFENIISDILKEHGHTVTDRLNPGHDRLVDGVKTEIKGGLSTDRNNDYRIVFNHIGFEKDWDQIILACVNGDGELVIAAYSKENFPREYIQHQQGGKNSTNDDFMVPANKSKAILFDNRSIKLI